MNNDYIIRMAREAGIGDTGVRGDFIFFQPGTEGLERFAALVVGECIDAVMSGDRHRREYFAEKIKQRFGMSDYED